MKQINPLQYYYYLCNGHLYCISQSVITARNIVKNHLPSYKILRKQGGYNLLKRANVLFYMKSYIYRSRTSNSFFRKYNHNILYYDLNYYQGSNFKPCNH